MSLLFFDWRPWQKTTHGRAAAQVVHWFPSSGISTPSKVVMPLTVFLVGVQTQATFEV